MQQECAAGVRELFDQAARDYDRVEPLMAFGSGPLNKYDYVCTAAASLASLILQQSDSVGLAVFDAKVRAFHSPSSQPPHLKEIVRSLENGTSAAPTKIGPVLHEIAGRVRQRGLVMLLSDLFDDVEKRILVTTQSGTASDSTCSRSRGLICVPMSTSQPRRSSRHWRKLESLWNGYGRQRKQWPILSFCHAAR